MRRSFVLAWMSIETVVIESCLFFWFDCVFLFSIFEMDEYWNSCDWILLIFLIRLCFPILNLCTVSKK